ncbi:hypothetical protein ANN_05998 [Periplaneta americana]|uniref:Uncharacterized protein n=1 Tax=Periplaneta americana TaxID=6978 RepID=A0ABQ8TCB8_PERAM|nr:hypothetical protein ANN_05998 [Periplaneta americana]
MTQKKYAKTKAKKIATALNRKFFQQSESSDTQQEPEDEILENLKRAFTSADTTKHMIRVAKNLANRGPLMCSPDKKKGQSLTEETITLVHEFYHSEEVSRTMPGKKDFVTVRTEDGKKRTYSEEVGSVQSDGIISAI